MSARTVAAKRRPGPDAHNWRMAKTYLNASEVAELAELLEDAPARVGVVDEVLQAAAEGRGMTLRLHLAPPRDEARNAGWRDRSVSEERG